MHQRQLRTFEHQRVLSGVTKAELSEALMWTLKQPFVLFPAAAVHQRQLHTFLTQLFALEGSAAGSGMRLCAPPRRSGTVLALRTTYA